MRAVAAAATLGDRDLMVIHGSDDETVPVLDARAIADACPGADLRIIGGAGHHLRHDLRAVAVLIGWLESAAAPCWPETRMRRRVPSNPCTIETWPYQTIIPRLVR